MKNLFFGISPSHNRWNAVGGKLHILAQIEGVHRLDKPDAAHLEQIVHALAAAGEFLDHGQHQPEIARDQGLPRIIVSGPRFLEQGPRFARLQDGEPGRVHSADLDFSLHDRISFFGCGHYYFPSREI